MKKVLKIFCIAVLIVTLIVSTILYFKDKKQDVEEEKIFDELKNIISDSNKDDNENQEMDYSMLFEQNEDMIGWLKIDGTEINYPVMQTKDRPNYYLRKNFHKEYSYYGTPYMQENCDIDASDNLIIYGHHINNSRMLGVLEKYKSKPFLKEHNIITLITKNDIRKYEIIYVIKTRADTGFKYNNYINFKDEEDFNSFKNNCERISIHKIDNDIKFGDSFITLSTCDYSQKNGRLVLVGKK